MDCETCRLLLATAPYADNTDAPDPTLAAARTHADACVACQAFLRAGADLDTLLAVDEGATPRPGFDTRFWARLAERRAGKRRFVWLGAGALATASLAAWVFVASTTPLPVGELRDLELAQDLDLIEDLEVVQHLDEVEAFELLAQVDLTTLDNLAGAATQQGDDRGSEPSGSLPGVPQ